MSKRIGDVRIVSLVPSLTESLWDLGVGRQVVGVTRFCVRPSQALESATVRFVTGFPNLRFAHVDDPLALQGEAVEDLLRIHTPLDDLDRDLLFELTVVADRKVDGPHASAAEDLLDLVFPDRLHAASRSAAREGRRPGGGPLTIK